MRIALHRRDMFHLESRRSNRGFTMIELLVVMILIAAMALVATPWLIKIGQRNEIKSAAREIAIGLAAARMKAVKRNAQVSFIITSSTPPLEFSTVEPPPPNPTPTRVPQRLEIPRNAARFVATPNGGVITFGGDGRVVASVNPTIQVEGPVSSALRNRIDIIAWSNGRIEVVTPTNWK